ncbi:class F sortase, partial [Streptomyces olivaceus]
MRRVKDTAIAAVTAVALGSGAWLLLGGARTEAPPQPSRSPRATSSSSPTGVCSETGSWAR